MSVVDERNGQHISTFGGFSTDYLKNKYNK